MSKKIVYFQKIWWMINLEYLWKFILFFFDVFKAWSYYVILNNNSYLYAGEVVLLHMKQNMNKYNKIRNIDLKKFDYKILVS